MSEEFNPEEFRNEIMRQNQELRENVLAIVSGLKAGETAVKDDDLEDDDEDLTPQAKKKLGNLIQKKVQDLAPTFEQDLLNKVAHKQNQDAIRAEFNALVSKKFPDVMSKKSPLFTEASRILGNFDDNLKSSPYSHASAVLLAALKLGISPANVEDAYAAMAENPSSTGSSSKKANDDSKQIQDLASQFGIDPEKLKNNLSKQKRRS